MLECFTSYKLYVHACPDAERSKQVKTGPHPSSSVMGQATAALAAFSASGTVLFGPEKVLGKGCLYTVRVILVPRPSPQPVFDHLQYANTHTGGGNGLGMRLVRVLTRFFLSHPSDYLQVPGAIGAGGLGGLQTSGLGGFGGLQQNSLVGGHAQTAGLTLGGR